MQALEAFRRKTEQTQFPRLVNAHDFLKNRLILLKFFFFSAVGSDSSITHGSLMLNTDITK